MPGKDGSVPPALRNPPVFKIAPVKNYCDGSRPDEPDWFQKGTSHYQNNIRSISAIKDNFNRMSPEHGLCMSRFPLGASVDRVHSFSGEGADMFSDTALEAFKSDVNENDFGPLSQIFEETNFMQMKRRVLKKNLFRVPFYTFSEAFLGQNLTHVFQ
jgi:hypothetical protein